MPAAKVVVAGERQPSRVRIALLDDLADDRPRAFLLVLQPVTPIGEVVSKLLRRQELLEDLLAMAGERELSRPRRPPGPSIPLDSVTSPRSRPVHA